MIRKVTHNALCLVGAALPPGTLSTLVPSSTVKNTVPSTGSEEILESCSRRALDSQSLLDIRTQLFFLQCYAFIDRFCGRAVPNYVFMFVCARMSTGADTHAYMCGSQRKLSGVIPQAPSTFSKTGSLTGLEFIK